MLRLGPKRTPSTDAQGADAILHDVRNLLVTVASLVIRTRESLETRSPRDTDEFLEKLGSAVGETLAVANAGHAAVHRVVFTPAIYVSEHVAALAGLFDRPRRFSVTLRPASSSAQVAIPRIDLLRVLMNLVRNAEQASRPDGEVELAVELETIGESTETYGSQLSAGTYMAFQVIDSGCGFDPEALPAVLPARPGRLGIGLKVTTQLLEEAGGGLRIHQRACGGTMVEALVPICR